MNHKTEHNMKIQSFILISFLILAPFEIVNTQDILLMSSSSDAQSDTRCAMSLYGASFDIAGPEELSRMDFNLQEYKAIMVCEDWDTGLSDVIIEHHIGLENFARRGGVLVFLFSGNLENYQEYSEAWQALSLQLKRVSNKDREPEIGVFDPDHSAHPLTKRFANNYLGMFTHYGFENPAETWETIAYAGSSKVPIMLESETGNGKIVVVSILDLTKNYQQKYHYTNLFGNIVRYCLDRAL